MKHLLNKLRQQHHLTKTEWLSLLQNRTPELAEELFAMAQEERCRHFGKGVYIRGLIEFTNYCRNDCYYCGIRKGNAASERYRLTEAQILSCCEQGYQAGIQTFVLQGGEDGFFTTERFVRIIRQIKDRYPNCALTLSIGERPKQDYQAFYDAGADRYLLRHETYNADHYHKLHPDTMSRDHRLSCLQSLREIGFQTGCGMMVGSPFQTLEHLAEDLVFLQNFRPHMIGIGPFLPHHATPFAGYSAGSLDLTLFLLGLVRLMIPNVLLPSTTALSTVHPDGRKLGILAGGNVIMPNISPTKHRGQYALYDNKRCTGSEAVEGLRLLEAELHSIGYHIDLCRGDSPVT